MKKSVKKAVVAAAFSATMFLSMNTANAAAKLEWVKDVYPKMWDYKIVKFEDGKYAQVYRNYKDYFYVKCEKVTDGKCWVSN